MKYSIFSSLILSLILIAGSAEATPPDSIKIKLDSTSTLSVIVFHPVKKNPSNHYIKEVLVKLNGVEIIKQDFQSQTDTKRQNVKYILIDAKPGDKITVTADCSLYGEVTQMLALPSEKSGGGK
jgi:hypothetical protein